MALSRYLSPRRIRRALVLLRTWRSMPARLSRSRLSDLLPSLDPRVPGAGEPVSDGTRRDQLLREYQDLTVFFVHRARLGVDNRCLPRSLSLYHCLRSEGVPVELVFGVRPSAEIDEGHAWLELAGTPVLEPEHRLVGFVPIFRHPDPDS